MLWWWSETLSWEQSFFSIIHRDKGSSDGKESACNARVQFSSVAQLCLTLCDPLNRSMPGLPVHHQLPEFTQTHVHWVGDAIEPSHPLLPPSPAALNLSQHQGFFKWGVISPLVISPIGSILGTYQSGEFFQYPIFCLFILFMVFSRQEYGSGLPFPSPVDHILSDLSTMTHPSWVAPHHGLVSLS